MGIVEKLRSSNSPPLVTRPGDRRSVSRSATRALDILEYFGEVRRPLRAIEIARSLNLHPATADQLLKTMVDSAHLIFNARTKTYLPSPRLARFAGWVGESCRQGAALQSLLRNVESETGGIVTLATSNGICMQILDRRGSSPRHDTPERGLKTPIFRSVHGWAYLSTLCEAEIGRLAERARITAEDLPQVFDQIEIIRQAGFAETAIPEAQAWTLAVPLPAEFFDFSLVLGLTGPEEEFDDFDRLHRQMRGSIARTFATQSDRQLASAIEHAPSLG